MKFQTQLTPLMPVVMGMLGLILLTHSAAAFIGNAAYKKKMNAEILSIRRFSKNENTARVLTIKRGGTSFFALMASVVGYDMILYLVDYLVSHS